MTVPEEFDRALPLVVADVRQGDLRTLAVVEALEHVWQTCDVRALRTELRDLEGRLDLTEHQVRDRELLRAYDVVYHVLGWRPTHEELTELVRRLAAPEFVPLTTLQEWWTHRALRDDLRWTERR